MIQLAKPPPFALNSDVDIRLLDHLSAEEIDRLPFGVIGLDKDGKIFRYNLAEARFARLDRNQVVGRHFFRQVAPCTATPEFEGRFEAFAAAPSHTPVSFSYIFDFKFGAQEVDIELVMGRDATRFYLCVNRTTFLPRRQEQREELLAPSQADLAPEEPDAGVLRDQAAQRTVIASPVFFSSLMQTWDRMAPRAWGLFCSEWGTRWGRYAVVDLEAEVLEARGATLGELPMREAVEVISRYLLRHGWGRLKIDFAPAKQGAFVLELERNGLAEALGDSEIPRCHLLAGFLRAVFAHLAHKVIVVEEVCCKTQGFDRCRFVAVGEAKQEALKVALDAGAPDVDGVLQALNGAARGGS